MPKYIIKDDQNAVVAIIIATLDFVQANYANFEELIEDAPIVIKKYKLYEFIDLFTDAEFKAILAAIKNQPTAEAWFEKIKMLDYITKDNPKIDAGLNYMAQVGILTQARYDEIIGAM